MKQNKNEKKGKKYIFIIIGIIIIIGLFLIFSSKKSSNFKTYEVGKDIDSGEYILVGTSTYKIGDNESDKDYGYYEVCNNKECNVENGDVITNSNFIGKSYVIVQDGQYLRTKHAKLYKVNEYKATLADSISYYSNYMLESFYKIGNDLSAGTYTITGDSYYYSICSKPSCKVSISSNEIISNATATGTSTITVQDGQYLIIKGSKNVTISK